MTEDKKLTLEELNSNRRNDLNERNRRAIEASTTFSEGNSSMQWNYQTGQFQKVSNKRK